jgi:hypothetical protein
MPRGSYLFCFAKKGNPKKATPTIGLILRCSEKAERKKLATLRQFFVLIAFFFRFSGPINGVAFFGLLSLAKQRK